MLKSSLFSPLKRLYEPRGLVRINRASPLAAGLVLAEFGAFDYDSAGNSKPVRVGNTFAARSFGRSFVMNGTTDCVKHGTSVGGVDLFADSTRQWSVVALVKQTAANSTGVVVAKTSQSPTLRTFHLYYETGTFYCHTRGLQTNLGGSASNTNYQQITQTWDGSVSQSFLDYASPVSVAVGTASNETSDQICFGARANGTGLFLAGELAYVLIYNRPITRAEHLAIKANPRAVIADDIAAVWISGPSGGTIHTASYSDSATATDAVTAVFVAAAAIGETATAGDAFTAALVTSAAYSDAAAPADDYAATLVAAGQSDYSDTATPLDSLLAALVTSASWADAAVPVDAIAAALVAQRDYAESAAPADAYDAVVISGSTNAYSDQAAPLDAYAAVLIARAAYAETCPAQDSYAALLPGEVDISLRRSVHVRLSDQAPVVRLQSQSPVAKL